MTATSGVEATGRASLDSLLAGDRWDGPVAWTAPDSASDYETSARSVEPAIASVSALSSRQVATVGAALDTGAAGAAAGYSVEGFTALAVSPGSARSGSGDIRVANTARPISAYAYVPLDGHPLDGDVFFGELGRDPRVGNYDHLTILHELGHALGLEHPHDVSGGASWDSPEYTVMTYRGWSGQATPAMWGEAWGRPQTYMQLDIAALQHLYGADFSTRAESTVYRWNPETGAATVNGATALVPGANRIFQTIWDGGGRDVYDLSNYATDLAIDLEPGRHSTFDRDQLAYLGGGPNGGYARGNVFNALQYEGDARSLIEDARGGSGDDLIAGNAAANYLTGGAGNDQLYGRDGNDTLTGDDGNDRLSGGNGNDRLFGKAGADYLIGWSGSDYLSGYDGNDLMRGQSGDDTLLGGAGADRLIGGWGEDVFRFTSVTQSTMSNPDRIQAGDEAPAFQGAGIAWGDRIDLSAIDADATRDGNQAFTLGVERGAGSLWLEEFGTNTHVRGNTGGGSTATFQIVVEDGALRAADYGADDFLL